jgi:DUF2934 family protein
MVDLSVSTSRRQSLKAVADAETVTATPVITDEPGTDEFHHMVAVAAYYLAERRNFEPGHELEDWLTAETQVWADVGSLQRP